MRMAGEEEKEEKSKSQQGHQSMFLEQAEQQERWSSESSSGTRTNILITKETASPQAKIVLG